jgi:AcrR family transcriptional regulator
MPDDPTPSPPPKRRGRPPAGGREAILDATLALLRERGVARLTTREVAERAGVSEASVYYHYTDKPGLLQAVFEHGLEPLQAFGQRGAGEDEGDAGDVMARLARAIEQSLDVVLPVLMAAQSDVELRDALADYMKAQNLGPHRGIELLARRIATEQQAGRMRDDVDPASAAILLVGAAYLRSSQRQIMGKNLRPLPSLEGIVSTLETLLAR